MQHATSNVAHLQYCKYLKSFAEVKDIHVE